MNARSTRFALAAALALGAPAAAQTTHVVTVTDFEFTPATLTIQAGDTVEWQNTQGLHSVDETTASNPAGFGNAIASAPWTYAFTFSTAGAFTYECGFHGASMSGSVTVTPGTSTEPPPEAGFRLDAPAPNPFSRAVAFRLSVARAEAVRVAVHDLAGREVALLYDGRVAPPNVLALTWEPGAEVAAGGYLLVVAGDTFEATRRFIRTR